MVDNLVSSLARDGEPVEGLPCFPAHIGLFAQRRRRWNIESVVMPRRPWQRSCRMSSQSPERAFAPSRALAAFALGTLLLACGRPATEAECKRVVEKNVEVQMRKMNMDDPASIDKEKARILASSSSGAPPRP